MGGIFKYDYAYDLKRYRFKKVAALIREGDISVLNQEERDLLADLIETKVKKPPGQLKGDDFYLAEVLHSEYTVLRLYGMTSDELEEYIETHATADNLRQLISALKRKGMNRTDAIKALADKNIAGVKEVMGIKNVERLVDLWAKHERENREEPQEIT